MSDSKDSILEFVGTAFDELADADIPVFKQVKAGFHVLKTGIALYGKAHDAQYTEYQKKFQKELKELSKSPHTDTTHLKILLENFSRVIHESDNPVNLCKSPMDLANALRKGSDIPTESKLPINIAQIFSDNITKVFSSEELINAAYDKIVHESKIIQRTIQTEAQTIVDATKAIIPKESSFQNYLNRVILPGKKSGYENRFLYTNDDTPLQGRKKEIEQVERFLRSDGDVSIWAICGQGGIGKSKLARYFCLNYDEYKFVWLTKTEFDIIANITANIRDYSSDKTVVFICDYANEREEAIVCLIDEIFNFNSSQECKRINAKFLLLTRNEKWFPSFIRKRKYKSFCYKPFNLIEPLNLSKYEYELGKETIEKIICKFQNNYYSAHQKLSERDIDTILERVNRIIPTNSINNRANRCLFILLVADSYLQNPDVIAESADDLLREYFKRSKEHIEKSDVRYPEIIDAGFRVYAFATALRSLYLYDSTLPEFIKTDIADIHDELKDDQQKINEFFSNITDSSFSNNTIPPYEPDIIGEYLFLWVFFDCLTKDTPQKWCEYLAQQAEGGNNSIKTFIDRITADWPEYGDDKKNFFQNYSRIVQEMKERENSHA